MRSAEGVYLVEGPVLIGEALGAGVPVEALYAEEAVLGDPEVRAAEAAGVRCHAVRDGVLAKVLEQRAPRPMVAIAAQQVAGAHELVRSAAAAQRPLLVVVDLADPGNAGTLIRVAEASGCVGLAAVGRSVDVFNPKTVRASAGSLFRLPVAQADELGGLSDALAASEVPTVGTTGRGGAGAGTPAPQIDDVDLGGAFALLIGNEAHGLGTDVLGRCDRCVAIPMEGAVESLNAAVAGAVVLFEAARRRRVQQRGGGSGASLGQNEPRPARNTEDRPDV